MELFPKIVDFSIDILDKCMFVVYCPVCMVISCGKCITSDKNMEIQPAEITVMYNELIIYHRCALHYL